MNPPFGTYRLPPWRDALRRRAGALRGVHKGVSSLVRRAAQSGARAPFDIEHAPDLRLRLWPEENVADKRAFLGLDMRDEAETRAIERAIELAQGGRFRFVDIGANSGMYSLAFTRAGRRANLRPHGVAIEANPLMHARLVFNLEASGAAWTLERDGVIAVPCAVSDREGTVLFDTSAANLGEGRVGEAGEPVPARTLAAILDEVGLERVDILKIDVEGHEVPALEPYLRDAEPARHPHVVMAETLHDDGSLASLVERHGYRTVAKTRMDTIWERT